SFTLSCSHHSSISFIFSLSLHDALPILGMLEKDIEPTLIRFSSTSPSEWKRIKNIDQLGLPAVQQPRILLFIHGTFSSTLGAFRDRKSTRLNSSHVKISYAVFCLKKKKI